MRAVVVLPSIVPDFTRDCMATIHPDLIDPANMPQPPTSQRETEVRVVNGRTWTDGVPDLRLVVVWNTPKLNLGCSGSWNVGVDEVLRSGADWLVILSASVRFGAEGGRDFMGALSAWRISAESHLARHPESVWQFLGLEADDGLGWHLIAFPRGVLETVGHFDPIFHPAYHEDNDYSWRIQCAYGITPDDYPIWPKVPVDASLVEVAHGIKRGGVDVDLVGLARKFEEKWGGPSGSEKWCHPYNDESLDHAFTGTHVTARITSLGVNPA